MAKRLLGNDPFVRAVAPKPVPDAPAARVEPPPAPPAAKKIRKAQAVLPSSPPVVRLPPAVRSISRPRPVDEPSSSPLAAAKGIVEAFLAGLGVSGGSELDAFGHDSQLERAAMPAIDFLYRSWWRVEVQGADQLPTGASVLVSNHSGALPFDGPMLARAIERERTDLRKPRWLVEDQIFHAPFLGTIVNRLGAVRACPENALALLGERRPVIVFPEGVQGIGKPVRERYQLKRLGRGGFAKVAVRAGAPIVPVAVIGPEDAMPLLARLPGRMFGVPYVPLMPPPLPAKWIIRFGAPISVEGKTREATEEIQPLVDATRQAIETMLGELQRQRPSAFAR